MTDFREDIKDLESAVMKLDTMVKEYKEAKWDIEKSHRLQETFCQHEIARLSLKAVQSRIDALMMDMTNIIIKEEKSKIKEG